MLTRQRVRDVALSALLWRRSLVAAAALGMVGFFAGGCSDGYYVAPRADAPPKLPNAVCPDAPSAGDQCSESCSVPKGCGSSFGTRACTCLSGVFVQCACLPPPEWPYKEPPAADWCDRFTGEPRYIRGKTCTKPGLQCLSSTEPGTGCECDAANNLWKCGAPEPGALFPNGIPEGAPECEANGDNLWGPLDEEPCDVPWQVCVSRDYNPEGTSPRGAFCNGNDMQWVGGATNRWWYKK